MELKQVVVNNGGMSQDMSISKQDDKFAFENKNIRIQATDDGTMLSITNLRNPKVTKTVNIPCDQILGSCVTPDYLVIFCIYKDSNLHYSYDCIYRIDLNSVDVENSCHVLYKTSKRRNGNLNFSTSSYFDTLYYEEGETVKKVYWTDGINKPRVINLVTPSERAGGEFASYTSNVFEFYPDIYKVVSGARPWMTHTVIPEINVTKNRTVASELPAGVIQYFMSYYTINGAETLIAASSDLYTIDYSNRGAKADESGMCAFDIEIPADNVNTNFDYIRVYSALRTTENGPLIVKIVGDIPISKDNTSESSYSYKITDTGINQEQLQDGYIDFIGGTPFVAKTLTQKDGTAFFGNITAKDVLLSDEMRNVITENCFEEDYISSAINFSLEKEIPNGPTIFSNKYSYKLQLDKGSKSYKTFKSGERYRFGIQFQTKQGQWTDVAWIGDKECTERPTYDEENQIFKVNDATFRLPTEVQNVAKAEEYVAYRILYADPENSNGRRIKAQGILCPTMFTPGQRAMNAPYSLPSWVMRPKNAGPKGVAYHHFEPIFSSVVDGAEIASYTPKIIWNDNIKYPVPYIVENKNDTEDEERCYLVTYVTVGNGSKLLVRMVKLWATVYDRDRNFYKADGTEPTNYEVLCDYIVPYGKGVNYFNDALNALPESGNKNNPYGYNAISGNKYVYTQYNYTSESDKGTAPSDQPQVISLFSALSSLGVSTSSAPDPTFLNSVDARLMRSANCVTNQFIDTYYEETSVSNPYVIGKKSRNISYTGDSILSEAIKQGYIPIYGRNGVSSSSCSISSVEPAPTHSGSDYNTEDWLNDYEKCIFSTTKKVYQAHPGNSLNVMYFCTLPEIFRPRCTVNGPTPSGDPDHPATDTGWGGSGSGSDSEKYRHSNYNLITHKYDGINGYWLYLEGFIRIELLSNEKKSKEIKDSYNDYYVDESIVTLNSPDIDDVPQDNENINLNVVGIVPLNNCTSVFDATIKKYASSVYGGLYLSNVFSNNEEEFHPLYSEFLYSDLGWNVDKTKLLASDATVYKTYLFAANNILGVSSFSELEDAGASTELPGVIEKQQILNQYFSKNTYYLGKDCKYEDVYYNKIDLENDSTIIKTNTGYGIYRPTYSNLITSDETGTSHIYRKLDDISGTPSKNKLSFGTTFVKFTTSPHVVLNLQDKDNLNHKYLLPHFKTELDYYRSIYDGKLNVWSNKSEEQTSTVNQQIPPKPELVRAEWTWNGMQESLQEVKAITSIWDEPDKSQIYTSEDCFIFIETTDSTPPEIVNASIAAYIESHKTDQKVIDTFNNNYIYNSQTNYWELKENGNCFIIGEYQVGQYNSETRTYLFNTIKQKITIFGVNILNTIVTGPDIIETETFINQAKLIGETEICSTDWGTIYEDLDETDEAGNNKKFCFVWYKDCQINSWTAGDCKKYVEYNIIDFPVNYESKQLDIDEDLYSSNPYLYLGELYYNIDTEDLYGGTDSTALRKLSWIPASKVVSLDTTSVSNMEGDTYYQRWDCLKTYPTTEKDVNQIVDITSFMVETHKNLDGRSDVNRASYSLSSRPHNFNLFNEVYNQKNNIFEYTVRWNELSSENIPNQIVWSMTKNYLGDVDTWTNVSTSSSTRVTYPVTKLVNYNNTVMALTEHSLEVVNFNAKQLIPSTDNTFIELQNSNKVDGTTKLQAPYGSHNMSTLITEKGFYFFEDNEKSLIRMGGEAGITKIGTTTLIDWLKNHIVQGTYVEENKKPFRLEYDSIHKDIYIVNDEYCLVYSETLESFISFITYSGEYWLYTHNGKLYAYRLDSNTNLHLYEMYAEDGYNGDFQEYNHQEEQWENPVDLEYSVWYRINPGAHTDKMFTNGTLMADVDITGTNSNRELKALPNSTKSLDKPFDTLRVWTEYQDTGEVQLEHILDRPSLLKQKFRYWRFIIPRDKSGFKRDRIRNPWIHLQLKGKSTKKMEFHNMTIQYME